MVQRVGGDSARAVSWSWQLTSPTPDSTFGASERDQLMGGVVVWPQLVSLVCSLVWRVRRRRKAEACDT